MRIKINATAMALALTFAVLGSLLISGCSKQNELSRAEAKELILGVATYPNEKTKKLLVYNSNTYDRVIAKQIQPFYLFPDYLQVSLGKSKFRAELKELGKQYVRGEERSDRFARRIPVLAYVGGFGEITGIAFENEERSVAVVEYTEKYLPTPLGLLDTMINQVQGRDRLQQRMVNRKAVLKMYDDGWRVVDGVEKVLRVQQEDSTHAAGQDGVVLIDTGSDSKFVRIPLQIYMKNNPGLDRIFKTRPEFSDYFAIQENLRPSEKSKLEESDKAYKKAMGQKGSVADKKTKSTPKITTVIEKRDIEKAKQDIRALEAALMLYRLDNNVYPTTDQGLKALIKKPSSPEPVNWKEGGYVDRWPLDPWGNAYQYLGQDKDGSPKIYSLGPDGVNSPDDLGKK